MSPEQAAGGEITPATDMYSFGLLLQILLSEVPPYPESSTSEQILNLSHKAQTQVPNDIPRYWLKLIQALKSQAPVDRPTAQSALDTVEYIHSKPARRIKWIGIAVAVLLLLAATGKYIVDLKHERQLALVAQQKAEQVVQFLSSMFQQANPYDAQGNEFTAVDLLNQGAERIDQELSSQPDAQVYLKSIMADSYRLLSQTNHAEKLLNEASTALEQHPDISSSTQVQLSESLIEYYIEVDQYDQAISMIEKFLSSQYSVPMNKQINMRNTLALIYIRQNHCDLSVVIADEVLAEINNIDQAMDNEKITAINIKGMCAYQSGDYHKAVDSFLQGRKVISQSADDFTDMDHSFVNNIGIAYSAMNNDENALEWGLLHKDLQEEFLPTGHLDLALTYSSLAVKYLNVEELENAKLWNQKAIDILELKYASEDADKAQSLYLFATTLSQKASILVEEGQLDQAIDVYQDCIDKYAMVLPEDHELLANNYALKAQTEWKIANRQSDAITDLNTALKIYKNIDQPLIRTHLEARKLQINISQNSDLALAKKQLNELLSELESENSDQLDTVKQQFIELLK
jgi:serine/threonine-protein kinase